MPVQTTYAKGIPAAYEGMIANSEPHDIISMIVESAAGIGFGKAVAQGAADDGIVVIPASAIKLVGITEGAHFGLSVVGGGTPDLYGQYETVPVVKKGVIWVLASLAVAKGDPVYVVPTTGVFTNVSNSSANSLFANAIWDSSTGAAGLAKVRLA